MPITPRQGFSGGGSSVIITGTHLGGASAVHFDEDRAAITANTGTSVTVVSPSGQGVARVTVTTAGGTSGPQYFYYIAPPVIRTISPAVGPLAGGTTVTLTGRGLATASLVRFGTSTAVPTVVSDNQLTVVTPARAAGAASVVVTTIGGRAGDTVFTYVGAPTIASFTPISGPLTGGNTVTFTGTNLLRTTGVTFGGVPSTIFGALSDTRLAAIAPAHAIGTVSLAVTTVGGSVTAPLTYLYLL